MKDRIQNLISSRCEKDHRVGWGAGGSTVGSNFFLLERKKYLDDVAVVADDACLLSEGEKSKNTCVG